jgi:two-component sensor histidine kinase
MSDSVPGPGDGEEESDAALRMLELRHRMKNVLAIIQSLVNQTLRSGRSMEEARQSLNRRLVAMGNAVDMLLETAWTPAQLRDLVGRALAHADGRVTLEGPDITVGPDAAMSLNLVLHELESNAVKYGALSNDGGTVAVRWRVEEKEGVRCLALEWREQDGPPVVPPSRQGFGSRMISKVIGNRFGGDSQTEFAPDGLRWRLSASLEGLAS